MSHLGELLSALIDGELSGTELDRANTHLAQCPQCQAEATRLRELKRELRDFGGVGCPGELTARLLAMGRTGSGLARLAGPDLPRSLPRDPERRGRRRRGRTAGRGRAPGHSVSAPRAGAPASRRRPGRYMLWSAVSLVVVGIGAAAFSMGGTPGAGVRQITPKQLEVYDIQHAITAGEVPFADPSDSAAEATKP